jgi:hypothetical protein
MARPKGLPKTGGRQKGTPNKNDAEQKAFITKFLSEYMDSTGLYQDWKELSAFQRTMLFEKFLGRTVANKAAIKVEGELEVNHGGKITIDFNFGDKDVDDDMKNIIDNI